MSRRAKETVVLKFGSSLLDGPHGFGRAAAEVFDQVERGRCVIVVVSATKGTTDRLVSYAGALSGTVGDRHLASLLKTGEESSVALFTIALAARGIEARLVTSEELGLATRGPLANAEPVSVDRQFLRSALDRDGVVVVPGFVGRDAGGEPSLLGRGGSDLTALFLGAELRADEVLLIKDVDGVYAGDPGQATSSRLTHASWSEVGRVGGGVVQTKALRFAQDRGLTFRVVGLGGEGTLVGRAVS